MTRVFTLINTLLFCFTLVCQGQQFETNQPVIDQENERIGRSSVVAIDPANYVSIPEGSKLYETYRIASPFGLHITYSQIIQQKEVLYAGAKLHIKNNGSYTVQDFLCRIQPSGANLYDYWLPTPTALIAVSETIDNDPIYPKQLFKDASGNILASYELSKHIRKDTTLFTKVFAVNPINSADTSYGGRFIDNNDISNTTLEAEMRWVKNTVPFENDSFVLESQFLRFRNISSPLDEPYYIYQDSVSLDRQDDHFEYLNVFYHINQVGTYVNNLGFDILTKKLEVDVHAYGGADNSGYTAKHHTLQFGDGGVDDAEDGEVVIHEFTHSLSEIASPNNTIGTQREAMEEGSCDYFAKSYSRTYNDNTPNQIFSWDGHNPFWSGFGINTKRIYPNDLKGYKDGDRDIWSSALMCLHDSIGREATDSLLLEHFFYQFGNATMPEMARVILQIDSSDFGRKNYSRVKGCFVEAEFIKWTVSTDKKAIPFPYKVLDQEGFARGIGDLTIPLPTVANYMVYNALGEQVSSGESALISLRSVDYSSGLYVIRILINETTYSLKILR
jgi:hypothetical protein